MDIYRTTLASIPSYDFEQQIQAGTHLLTFHFLFDEAYEEQYNILKRALDDRAKADPLVKGIEIVRDYDWVDWYVQWNEEVEEKPQSLRDLNDDLFVDMMRERQEEAKELLRRREVYTEALFWNVEVTDADGNTITGDVQPGGWLHNQDAEWRVRFVSDLDKIGKNDLMKMSIEFEVDE